MSRSVLQATSPLALALILGGCAASTPVSPPAIQVVAVDGSGSAQQTVSAQAAPVSIGDSLSGNLEEGDSRSPEDGLYDRYVFAAAAGTRVEIVMRSDAFDPYLIVGREGPDGWEEVGRDDDGLGEGLNSRLRFTVAEEGVFEIRARGFAGMGAGAYSLSIGDRGPAPQINFGSLAPGGSVNGAISDGDPEFESAEGYRYDGYRFSARAGDRLEFIARSDVFDTTLSVGRESRWGAWEDLAYDDDGLGEGTNSRLLFTAPEDGDYLVRLSSFSPNVTGDYALAMNAREPLPAPTPVTLGQTVEGALSGDDGQTDAGAPFDAYTIAAAAGTRLEITARSQSFDTVIEIGRREGPGGWTAYVYDDDGLGEGTDSRLRFTPTEDGPWEVRVMDYSGSQQGTYNLTVADRGPIPPPPPPGAISAGATVQGALADGDAVTPDEYVHDDYRIRAQAGQRLSITLRSEVLDPMLHIGVYGPDGALQPIVSDDDSGGGLDSRATFIPTTTGDYIIRATSYSPGVTGDYTLTVRDLGAEPRATRLRFGQTVRGALTDDDALSVAEIIYDRYSFRIGQNERAQFIARSDAFDTVLAVVRRLEDGDYELLAFDDDGLGEGTNSRLTFTAAEAGEYELWVTPYDETTRGAYSLESRQLGPAPEPVRLTIGDSRSGQLTADDNLAADNTTYDAYQFTGQAGQRIRIEMRSGDFNSFVLLGHYGMYGLEAVAQDDDGMGDGGNARLTYTLPADGEYEFWANTATPGELGAYEIRLIDLGPEPAPGSIVVGSTVRGSLTSEDPTDEFGSYFDAYRFQPAEGELVRITLSSNSFDAFILLGRMTNGLFVGELSDDDGLSDLNSRLDFTSTGGEYVLRVRSYGPGETGDYVLTVEPAPAQ